MSIIVLDGNGNEQTILTIADLVAVVSTAALQGTGNTTLASILTALAAAATAAGQDTGNTALDTLHTDLVALETLLAGGSTAAAQVTGNTALAAIKAAVEAAATATAQGAGNTLLTDVKGLLGEVQASPTANTLLDRAKTLHADLTALIALLPTALGTSSGLKTEPVGPAVTIAVNATVFPLGGGVLFAARANGRVRLEIYNPTTNSAATIAFASGFTFVLQPGGSYLRVADRHLRGSVGDGAITATGTAGETLQAEDAYL